VKIKQIKKTERNFSVNAEVAKTLLEKIIEKKQNNSIKNVYSMNSVLKMIGQIYSERLSSTQNINNPLYVMIYDLFLNKYGLKKICEAKYFQVFLNFCRFFIYFIDYLLNFNIFQ